MNTNYDYTGLANEVVSRNIPLAENFEDWTKLAMSLSNLGEDGRGMFKAISSLSSTYKDNENDKKFTNALQTNQRTDISTFVWMCKQQGIDVKKYAAKEDDGRRTQVKPIQHKETKPLQTDYIPKEDVIKSLSYNSDFVHYLCRLFDEEQIIRVTGDYALGATKNKGVIFWQIDTKGKVRTGKVMKYDNATGHRIHDNGVNWIHSVLMRNKGKRSADYNLRQCLFGEHLLRKYPNKRVAVVEAEKTAVICSAVYPAYVWVAAGGVGNMQAERLQVLSGRDVVLFPDTDTTGGTFSKWNDKAKELQAVCNSVIASDILEREATEEEKAAKIDIADCMVVDMEQQRQTRELLNPERLLAAMEEKNPAIKLLADTLGLEVVA